MSTARIESVIMEEVRDIVEGRLSDVRFTLKGALRRLYWPSYEQGKVSEVAIMKLDELVDVAFNTTHREGPEDASYPCLDEAKAKLIQDELRKLLGLTPDAA